MKAVAECDVAFGCMDGVEGRHVLNRIATFYLLPYFDVGVRLDADGAGGIERIAGAVHYIQPGGSSLLSREVYSMARVDAESLRRTNPEMYRRLIREGYLRGVDEDRPAVVSVNAFFASLVVNEFLARLHPYRNTPNKNYAYVAVFYRTRSEPVPIAAEARWKGRCGAVAREGDSVMKKFARKVVSVARRLLRPWITKNCWRIVRVDELPDVLKQRSLYLIGDGAPWSAALLCPCGCRDVIQLSLLHGDSPRWRLSFDGDELPTLVPSIRRTQGCRAHFFLRHGRVVWSDDVTNSEQARPRTRSC